MARHRPKIPKKVREDIAREAGGKCANPGCAYVAVEIHHILEWAVYESHDTRYLIALCPACHDSVHRGELRIDDATLNRWKKNRGPRRRTHTIHIDTGDNFCCIAGSVAIDIQDEVQLFTWPTHKIGFTIQDQDFSFVNLLLQRPNGDELVRIVNNQARYCDEHILVESRAGKFVVRAKNAGEVLPLWLFEQYKLAAPPGFGDEIVLLDVEILDPGVIGIRGVFASNDRAVVIDTDAIRFLYPDGWCAIAQMRIQADHGMPFFTHREGPNGFRIMGWEPH